MSSSFFPEMHDLAKLVDPKGSFPTTDGESLKVIEGDGPIFANLDWSRLGIEGPSKHPTLQAIVCAGNGSEALRDAAISPEARRCLFLLELAHRLASPFQARDLPRGGQFNPVLYKLWQPRFNSSIRADPPVSDASSLQEALQAVLSPQKASELWERFASFMEVRSDRDFRPFNIASMLSHSLLTRQFYRALDRKVQALDDPWRLSLDDVEASTPEEAEEKWHGRLVWGFVFFHQQPRVPEDLKVFETLKKCIRDLEGKFEDNVIACVSNNFWLFLPGQDDAELEEVARIFTSQGFGVRLRYQEAPLAVLGQSHAPEFRINLLEAMASELQRLKFESERRKAELEESIEQDGKSLSSVNREIAKLDEEFKRLTSEKIREANREQYRLTLERKKGIQNRIEAARKELERIESTLARIQVEMVWVAEQLKHEQASKNQAPLWKQVEFDEAEFARSRKAGVKVCAVCGVREATEDSLCSVCKAIREADSDLRIPAPWLSEGYLLWLYCYFEPRLWHPAILTLFSNYMDKSNPGDWEVSHRFKVKTTLRWPVLLRDFVEDYLDFLRGLELEICRLVGARNRIRLGDDLWVMPIKRGTKAAVLIRSYVSLLEEYFPALASLPDAPFFLGIYIAPASHPFSQVWRYIRRPPRPISIRLPNRENIETTISLMKELIRYGETLIGYRKGRRPSLEQVRIEELVSRNVIKRQDVRNFQALIEWHAES